MAGFSGLFSIELMKFVKKNWAGSFAFECFGVKIGVYFDDAEHLEKLTNILPEVASKLDFTEAEQIFQLVTKSSTSENGFYLNSEVAFEFEDFREEYFEHLESKILLAIALLSPPEYFFIHAGVVSLGGIGILIPGESFSGKTTLVKKFIESGAKYYTDDCAVLDFSGYVRIFPKTLSVRLSREKSVLLSPEDLGAESGVEAISVGLILFTKFEPNAIWNPVEITDGKAVFHLLEHFFYKTSVRRAPTETLAFLANLTAKAKVFESARADTREVFEWVEDYLKTQALKQTG